MNELKGGFYENGGPSCLRLLSINPQIVVADFLCWHQGSSFMNSSKSGSKPMIHSISKNAARALAMAAALLSVGSAHAALTTYSSSASFNAVLGQKGLDDFSKPHIGYRADAGPIRPAGDFSYVMAGWNPNGGITQVNGQSAFLSTWSADLWINGKYGPANAPMVNAVGVDVAPVTSDGSLAFRPGTVWVTVWEDDGSGQGWPGYGIRHDFEFNRTLPTDGTFFGVTTTGKINAIWYGVWPDSNGSRHMLVTNVTLGTVGPVPEPSTYALMLAGVGLLAAFSSRRKQRG